MRIEIEIQGPKNFSRRNLFLALGLALGAFFAAQAIFAWTSPTLAPPNGNVTLTSSQWTTGSSLIYYNGGSVGIGTTTPSSVLHIANSAPTITLQDSNNVTSDTGYASYLRFTDSAGSQMGYVGDGGTGLTLSLYGETGYSVNIGSGGTSGRLVVASSGNVGIGTASPSYGLDVFDGTGNGSFAAQIKNTNTASDGKGILNLVSSNPSAVSTLVFAGHRYFGTESDSVAVINNAAGGGITFNIGGVANSTQNEKMRIDNSGNVGIGTTSPGNNKLNVWDVSGYPAAHFYSSAGHTNVDIDSKTSSHAYLRFQKTGTTEWYILSYDSTNVLYINDANGNDGVYMNQNSTAWSANSDVRLKTNIVPITGALDRISKIRGVNFNWIDPDSGPDLQLGVIAQEVQRVFPEIVTEGKNGYFGVQYDKLGPILIEAVKELNGKFSAFVSDSNKIIGDLRSGIAKFAHLLADYVETHILKADRVEAPNIAVDNLQMKDSATGQLYCLTMYNGELRKVQGGCGN